MYVFAYANENVFHRLDSLASDATNDKVSTDIVSERMIIKRGEGWQRRRGEEGSGRLASRHPSPETTNESNDLTNDNKIDEIFPSMRMHFGGIGDGYDP